uniref:CCHC-type domain-containing protein n=1 Tax=Cannabis sativa TaxID=3483 RepID=A0A803NQ77_CANSA
MNSTLCLSEKERNVHSLSETDLHDPNQPPKFFLVARCLSSIVNPKTFIKKMGEFWSNKCRFEVVVSEMHSDIFLLTLACAGDKQRISSGEPWHFFNQLILLHSPSSLQNVTKEDFRFAQFWVQTHRLPFLSKSRALAKKVGEWVGEFVEVHEDSLHEGWGSFLRTRVRLDVTQPLMRGKMVSLPRVMDEHWLEFRYENLPVFCFYCGKIGHPFDKCLAFMELVDMGVDPDLLYGPQMIGDKLPISGYDRYRTDFSKANAYPFLTRLARKTITSSIPNASNYKNLTMGSVPQPKSLTNAELAQKDQPENSAKAKCPELPLPFPSYVPSNFPNANTSPITEPTPPYNRPLSLSPSETISKISSPSTEPSATAKLKGKAVIIDDSVDEAAIFSKTYKRQVDPDNFRSVLKRCRNNKKEDTKPDDHSAQFVSDKHSDSADGLSSCSAERPDVLFIMETKLQCNAIDRFRSSLRFSNGLEVPRLGLKGGLMLLWMANVDVTLNNYSMNHFDVLVSSDNCHQYHFTGFYGAPETHLRINSWNTLSSLVSTTPNMPWLVLGDFNELLSNDDKDGGPPRNDALMNNFRTTIDLCDLRPIPFCGDSFTWTNKNHHGNIIRERLDRGFFNSHWSDVFTEENIQHLDFYHSDHRAIAYTVSHPNQPAPPKKRNSRFRFEQFWLKDPDCSSIIAAHWNSSDTDQPLNSLLQNIAGCATALQNWHQNKYGSMGRDIAAAHQHSAKLHNVKSSATDHIQQMENADRILDDLLEKEELYWHQRARVDWLQSGDSNTKFFHSRAKTRNAVNKIKRLQSSAGGFVHTEEEISAEIVQYFSGLFSSNGVDNEALNHVISTVDTAITPDQNQQLLLPFTATEVDNALKSMAPDKAPGEDMDSINSALITLIPKVDHPKLWHSKLFSIGGREVLLKAVVQSIPTYAMSCFSLPKKFCAQLESMMANFWWGSNTDNSKIHWKKWKFMCSSKADGATVLQARYFKKGDFLSAKKGVLPSLTWQSICDGRDLLLKGLRWKIGSGRNVHCASDPWLPGNTTMTPFTYTGDPSFTVEHYISIHQTWDLRILQTHFGDIDIQRILSIPLSPFPREDKLIWQHSDTGIYSVKSGYQLAASLETQHEHSSSSTNRQWWNRMWSLRLPKKLKIFLWRFINEALPTAVNLAHRKISSSNACSLCQCSWVTSGHAIFRCKRAKAVWQQFQYKIYMPNMGNAKGYDIFSYIAAAHNDLELEQIVCLMWNIWSERNKETHGSKPKPVDVLCSYSASYLDQFHKATSSKQVAAGASSQEHLSTPPSVPTASRAPQTWRSPPAGLYKLNVDAACDQAVGTLGYGALIRDHMGDVVAGFSKPFPGFFSPKEMEAAALFHSLIWAIQHQLPIHLIETDSLCRQMQLILCLLLLL